MDTAIIDTNQRIKTRDAATLAKVRAEIRRLADQHMAQMAVEGWRMSTDERGNKFLTLEV